jgi:asparagine synthase (glutamine-hydrolysing)
MCGIAGIISPHNVFVNRQRLKTMADVLTHRGPDGEGYWLNAASTVGFAHRRLAIIDTTNAAAQPLHYLHYTVIFNGEIYNYVELKNELIQHGYIFQSQSDTEIIPAAFDHWGIDCLNHFDGMFAFTLWDDKMQRLIIARDRFGEKPLFYHAQYGQRGKFDQLLFASEMKALWAVGVPKQLNGTMMLNYITLGYVQHPLKKTETFYSNILSLPQGHYLHITPHDGNLKLHKWYKPSLKNISINEDDAIDQFKTLLTTSVQRRLRSDVCVGTSLSGGIDSAAVASFITEQADKQLWKNVAFTAIFPGFDKDESMQSATIANALNIHQYTTAPTANDWIEQFDALMYYQEEPVQSSSVLTQFMVYKLAREKGITVLLDGQGADEILGGYKKYMHWYLQQLFVTDKKLFEREKKLLLRNEFLESWGLRNYPAAYFPEKTAKALQQRAIKQQHSAFIQKDFLLHYQNEDTLQKPVVKSLEDILYYNSFNVGLPELLRYADRNSMAQSREVRLPFLFHELVEFVFSLPSSFKIYNGFTKYILRRSIDEMLPSNIVWQKGKIGYESPQHQWMQQQAIKEMIVDARKKLVDKNILDAAVIKTPVNPNHAHASHNFDWRYLSAAALFK